MVLIPQVMTPSGVASAPAAALVICPKCGQHIPATSKFCPNCGTTITQPTNQNMTCPKCGKSIPANSKFCPECGEKLG
jgi:predicted amidophosphoribosyltransferase